MNFKKYTRKGITLATSWTPEIDMTRISVSQADKENGSPKVGDMVARNPKDAGDMWLINAKYFEENLEEVKE